MLRPLFLDFQNGSIFLLLTTLNFSSNAQIYIFLKNRFFKVENENFASFSRGAKKIDLFCSVGKKTSGW